MWLSFCWVYGRVFVVGSGFGSVIWRAGGGGGGGGGGCCCEKM